MRNRIFEQNPIGIMTFDQFYKELKKKDWQPIYFLHGEESFFIDEITDYVEENVLEESEKAFNQTVVYGRDVDYLAVIDQARRYPMMAQRQLIILKEAQTMKTLDKLKAYVENPTPSTVLLICHKNKRLNMNSSLGRKLKSSAVVFESKKLYDNQVPDWIRSYLKSKQLTIVDDAAQLVAEYLGTDLSKVTNELDKLALNVAEGSNITTKEVEQYIGISKDYNVFELQKAIVSGSQVKANRIINYFLANPKKGPTVVVVASLYNFFSKVYMLHFLKGKDERETLSALGLKSPYFLREYRAATKRYNYPKTVQIIQLLKEYDLKSKGVDFNGVGKVDGVLLKELVWKIMN